MDRLAASLKQIKLELRVKQGGLVQELLSGMILSLLKIQYLLLLEKLRKHILFNWFLNKLRLKA